MREMQQAEYAFLVRELHPLTGSRFTKIYSLGPGRFRLRFGPHDLLVVLGQCAYLARSLPPDASLSPFSQKVRKELEGKRLERIEQWGKDRILAFYFDGYTLVLEMFAQGNALLLRGEKILACHRTEKWKDRIIQPGQVYRPPAPLRIDWGDVFSSEAIIYALGRYPLGIRYAKEVLYRCGITEQTPGDSLLPRQRTCLAETVQAMEQGSPYLFLENGRAVDYGVYAFHEYPDAWSCATLSEAVERCALDTPVDDTVHRKFERRLAKQKEALARLQDEEKQWKAAADRLLARYSSVNELLLLAQEKNWDELARRGVHADKKRKELRATI